MPDREGRRIGLRAGTVTGSSAGIGSRGGSTTAPPDNLAAIMRDATIIVGAGIRPAVKVHITKAPAPDRARHCGRSREPETRRPWRIFRWWARSLTQGELGSWREPRLSRTGGST